MSQQNAHHHDSILAAEHALGILRGEDRQVCQDRCAEDPHFAKLVEDWELHLAHFNSEFAEEQPPGHILRKIEARLFANNQQSSDISPASSASWWDSLALWRGLGIASLAALMITVGVSGYLYTELNSRSDSTSLQADNADTAETSGPFIADLKPHNSDTHFVALYDTEQQTLQISRKAGDQLVDKSYELWIIPADQDPISLGVLDQAKHLTALDQEHSQLFADQATLAVSIEQRGGSPTGAPEGEVVSLGQLAKI